MSKFIKTTIREFLNENINNIDKILDKMNKHGQRNLTFDERTYLKQYSDKNIDVNLEKWLFSDDENTFDLDGNKLLFDEFDDDEDIFYNYNKLKRVISKHLNKEPFTNNADWGGSYVWNINNNKITGIFLYLGDDELSVIERSIIDDEYNDEVIETITNSRELYRFLLSIKK